MKIKIDNKIITSVDVSEFETAWKIEDAILVSEYLKNRNKVILGGDILTKERIHNYDSWYYNINSCEDDNFNVECSYKSAVEYILKYIQSNGNEYYVIFVTNQ